VTPSPIFSPTLAAARARIAAVRPADYARTRNLVGGDVTHLSPYITHGFVTVPEVLAGVAARSSVGVQHKFVFELGWREYFRHVWAHRGEAILYSLHEGVLPDEAYAHELPAEIREARTGVPVIDCAVRTLYATGTLHNHARLWLASYVVHHRKVHWRAGADWLYGHLLDGDLASNHLSWQWVAGTGSHKPYLFNADNVARHAPPEWHSFGSVVDAPYAALECIARNPETAPLPAGAPFDGVEPPALHAAPPPGGPLATMCAPDPAEVDGRDVWLVHPWALREPPALPPDTVRIAVCLDEFHAVWPWSAARWSFVGARMAALAGPRWHGDVESVARALRGARSVQTVSDPHVDPALQQLATCRPPAALFAPVERPCASFSQWWARTLHGVTELHQLPGLAGQGQEPAIEGATAATANFTAHPTPTPAADARPDPTASAHASASATTDDAR
jgi:deoxyribodipyrimidine photo-lyase